MSVADPHHSTTARRGERAVEPTCKPVHIFFTEAGCVGKRPFVWPLLRRWRQRGLHLGEGRTRQQRGHQASPGTTEQCTALSSTDCPSHSALRSRSPGLPGDSRIHFNPCLRHSPLSASLHSAGRGMGKNTGAPALKINPKRGRGNLECAEEVPLLLPPPPTNVRQRLTPRPPSCLCS